MVSLPTIEFYLLRSLAGLEQTLGPGMTIKIPACCVEKYIQEPALERFSRLRINNPGY
jgi:hypothetical protein